MFKNTQFWCPQSYVTLYLRNPQAKEYQTSNPICDGYVPYGVQTTYDTVYPFLPIIPIEFWPTITHFCGLHQHVTLYLSNSQCKKCQTSGRICHRHLLSKIGRAH